MAQRKKATAKSSRGSRGQGSSSRSSGQEAGKFPHINPSCLFRWEANGDLSIVRMPEDRVFRLNEAAAFLWCRIDGRRTSAELMKAFTEELSGVSAKQLEAFLGKLFTNELLLISDVPVKPTQQIAFLLKAKPAKPGDGAPSIGQGKGRMAESAVAAGSYYY